jgi:hypothetical protein
MDGLYRQAECCGTCAGESVLSDATCKKHTIGTFGPKITHVTPHHEKNCNTGSASSLGDFLFFGIAKFLCGLLIISQSMRTIYRRNPFSFTCTDVSSHRPSAQLHATPPAVKARVLLLF